MADLITTEQIQYWLETSTGVFTRVTEDNAFDPSTDMTTYDPSYKDRLNQPSYVTGKKTSIEFDIDILDPGTLQEFLMDNEDETNVEVDIVRVMMFQPVGTEYTAKKATFNMNLNPLDGSAGEAVRATGTFKMTSDGWTAGTFDTTAGTFTETAESS